MPLIFYTMLALVQEFLPHMLEQGDGAILTAQGGSTVQGLPNMSGPSPAQAAQRNYLRHGGPSGSSARRIRHSGSRPWVRSRRLAPRHPSLPPACTPWAAGTTDCPVAQHAELATSPIARISPSLVRHHPRTGSYDRNRQPGGIADQGQRGTGVPQRVSGTGLTAGRKPR